MRKVLNPWIAGGIFVVALAMMILLPASPADSQRASIHLQLDRGAIGVMNTSQVELPLNCSLWHEIWPSYCTQRHQDSYSDNGDNVISVCDVVTLDGVPYHVDWVGMTYWVDMGGGATVAFEPTGTHDPLNPVCETWHVVYSDIPGIPVCSLWHVESWINLADPEIDDTDTLCFNDGLGTQCGVVVAEGTSVSTTPTGGFNIPTLSEWGILALLLILVGVGTLFIWRRNRSATA